MSAIRYERDAGGIVTLTLSAAQRSTNTMDAEFRAALAATIGRLEAERAAVTGVVLTSDKDSFFAGGDLRELSEVQPGDAEQFFAEVQALARELRRLETFGFPVVAAIGGSALGGGLELCLACHRRIALDDDRIRLGQPEVTLGVMPGAGAVVRLTRLLGLEKALPLLVEGTRLRPREALAAGLVHELAPDRAALGAQARAWIAAHPRAQQPWDAEGYRMPGGAPSHPGAAQLLAVAPALLIQKTHGCYPAPAAILSAAVEGAQVGFDAAQRIESRYFTSLVTSPIAKNMIGTLWFQMNEVKRGAARPRGIAPAQTRRVGILGAGMMGAGIAYACASRGIPVMLKDTSVDLAERGRAHTAKLLERKLARGHLSEAAAAETLARIVPVADNWALEGCDLIIEAVFEQRALKAQVTREAEPRLADGGVFASNTSTLPITGLAQAAARPERFIGLHFFSPVDRMALVEIIVGRATSDETLARAFDFVLAIDKVPIVVNDSRGFYTSRVFSAYVNEGMAMLGEGVAPASIEQAALQSGMPTGPLEVLDEVSLALAAHVRDQARADAEAEGRAQAPHPAERVLDTLLALGRKGKAAGAGFYEYPGGGRKQLWSGLEQHFGAAQRVPFEDVKERLLFIQALETVRCLEERVLRSVAEANVGSILGLGFAPWTGGTLQYVNWYGLDRFAARARVLAERYGERFTPPALLLATAERGARFA
jgi:3-hydroxyacyl-CoA dehydrogenase/enoyl-CoA hydratase/3-hydroxybutyryl-CoA epimerase